MITLEEAIALAERKIGSEVVRVKDCGDRWQIRFECDEPEDSNFKVTAETSPFEIFQHINTGYSDLFVYKSDGRIEFYSYYENADLIANGKEVKFWE